MLKPTSSPPQHISPEEHQSLTSSTPASFVDIPPVLRWSDEVEVVLSPPGAWAWEGRTKGTLWVTEAVVAFLPSAGTSTQGFELPYQSLTLHALTPASNEQEAHLYCQIDDSDADANAVGQPGSSGPQISVGYGESNANPIGNGASENEHMDGLGNEDEEEEDEEQYGAEFEEMRELRVFVTEGKLQPLFSALSSCSALHASLLPTGEPSSFPFFPPNSNGKFDDADGEAGDEAWVDVDEQPNGGEGGEGGEEGEGEGGRGTARTQRRRSQGQREREEQVEGDGDQEADLDPVERFLNLVDWGKVEKPQGWDSERDADADAVEDAEEGDEGQYDSLAEMMRAVGGLELSRRE